MQKVTHLWEIVDLKSQKTRILLYFSASWCPPCKMSRKLLETQLTSASSNLIVLDIDADEAEEIMRAYKVDVVPTYVALGKNFNVIEKIIGYQPQKIKGLLKKLKSQ